MVMLVSPGELAILLSNLCKVRTQVSYFEKEGNQVTEKLTCKGTFASFRIYLSEQRNGPEPRFEITIATPLDAEAQSHSYNLPVDDIVAIGGEIPGNLNIGMRHQGRKLSWFEFENRPMEEEV